MKKRIFITVVLFCLLLLSFSLFVKSSYYYNGTFGLNRSAVWSDNLTGVFHSSLVFGDISNDGKLDMVTMGCSAGGVDTCTTADKIRVYLNNGSTFTENLTWEMNLSNLGYGSLALGDIDNDGDLDLIALGDKGGGNGDVEIYLNNGTSFNENFTWELNLSNVDAYAGSLVLGDIDKNGRLDLALVGAFPSSDNGIYINNGTSFTKNSTWLQSLPFVGHGLGMGSLSLGDINKDGRLDLIFAGSRSTDFYDNIYRNNGTSLVGAEIGCDPCGLWGWPSQTLGDYDNDNDLDLAYMGTHGGDRLYVYNNTNGNFSQAQLVTGVFDGSVAFGDYDSNGYLDLGVMGKENGGNTITNNNNTFFQYDTVAEYDLHADDMQQGSLAWVDVDNNSILDLACTGYKYGDGLLTKIYISNSSRNNTLPQPPNSSFSAVYSNNEITLSWANGSDNETPTAGLYYNLRVGIASNKNAIVSGIYGGSSNPTAGYFGNMMQRKSIILHGDWLQANTTYYWSVQTIDTGLAKSSWSSEQSFTTSNDITYPSITLNDPSDNNYTSFSNITFNVTVSDNVNISNVSLYGSWDGWHRNQTNSLGLNGTNYIFQVNLSGYEGSYTWAIHACDTTGNCLFSANRTVIRDMNAPLIALESPANVSSWTSNNSVSFLFNVSDIAVANCSLIIGSSLKYNFTSITVNTTTNATIELGNGNYNWSVNCTDMLLRQNKSETRQLTVNYQAPVSASSGGGGSSSGALSLVYSIGELKEKEINRELRKGDKINFNLNEEGHNLTISSITKDNATIEINSTIARFTLGIGESRKLNLTSSEFYDLFIRLNDIKNFKANITIRKISESIFPEKEEKPQNTTNMNKTASSQEEEPVKESSPFSVLPYIAGGVIVAGLFLLYRKIRRKSPA